MHVYSISVTYVLLLDGRSPFVLASGWAGGLTTSKGTGLLSTHVTPIRHLGLKRMMSLAVQK